jgi:hypothetical protein
MYQPLMMDKNGNIEAMMNNEQPKTELLREKLPQSFCSQIQCGRSWD